MKDITSLKRETEEGFLKEHQNMNQFLETRENKEVKK